MNGATFKIILTQNFELGMIDEKTPVDFLQFSMRDHLLTRRKDLVHERHVVPTAGDPRGTKETAIRIDQDRFEQPFALTKTPLRGIDDLRTKTNRTETGRVHCKAQLPAVLMTLGEMIEQIRNGRVSGRSQGLKLTAHQEADLGQIIWGEYHGINVRNAFYQASPIAASFLR
jgi:hypothetical protein